MNKNWKPNKIPNRPTAQKATSNPASRPAVPTPDLKALWWSGPALLCCIFTLVGFYLLIPRYIEMPVSMIDRLSLVLRSELFVILWLVIGSAFTTVAKYRFEYSNAQSASEKSSLSAGREALRNTRELVFLTFSVHLVAATLLNGSELTFILSGVFLFCLGRFVYFVFQSRWPNAREFGDITSALPTFLLLGLATFHLITLK